MSDDVITEADTKEFVRSLEGQRTDSIERMRRVLAALEGLTPDQAEDVLDHWYGRYTLSLLGEVLESVEIALEGPPTAD